MARQAPGRATGTGRRRLRSRYGALRGTLRPYQRDGVAWLRLLARLGLGGCLADDMGLGKTIQIIALMLLLRTRRQDAARTFWSFPASLARQLASGARALRAVPCDFAVAHRSELSKDELVAARGGERARSQRSTIVLTTYGTLTRLDLAARETQWDLVVIDEAQAIKNPATAQSRAVKSLKSRLRFALTGTPDREPPGRGLVALRLPVSGPTRLRAGVHGAFTRRLTAEDGPGLRTLAPAPRSPTSCAA